MHEATSGMEIKRIKRREI